MALGTGGQRATQSGASSARGVSNASGGNRSTRSTQDGGMVRRRRQSMSKVVGGGLGTDSPDDIGAGRTKGQVRFEDTDFESLCFEGLCLTDSVGKGRDFSSRSVCSCAANGALHPGNGATASSSSRHDHVIDNDDAYIHNAAYINNVLSDEDATNATLNKHETTPRFPCFPCRPTPARRHKCIDP